jgi:hypothetical protein
MSGKDDRCKIHVTDYDITRTRSRAEDVAGIACVCGSGARLLYKRGLLLFRFSRLIFCKKKNRAWFHFDILLMIKIKASALIISK